MHLRKQAKAPLGENMTYRLYDKDGNAKRLWQLNKVGVLLLKALRRAVKPVAHVRNEHGEVVGSYVKPGLLNHLAAYGVRIPGITGSYTYALKGANLVTDAGKAGVASRINGAGSEAAFTYIGIGIGTTAAAAADTALESEITTSGGQRTSATASRTTTDVTNDTARLIATFNFTGSFAVTEAGALNAASVGVLLNRQVFSAVNVANGDSLQVTIDIDVD